jgi:hypothetical protein
VVSTYSQLQKDFVRGREGEDVVQEFLEKNLSIVTENLGKTCPYWDLDGRDMFEAMTKAKKDVSNYRKYGVTFEVKRDDTSQKTGNFYFEVWSNRQHLNAGCIPNCKADTLVIVSGKTYYFLNRALFYTWVFENLFLDTDLARDWKSRTNKASGNKGMVPAKNNSDVEGILLPLEHLKKSYACIEVFNG